ncbi:MAG: aminotransferase class IV [Candidatus Magnetoovum sp. WYHC-5]|nr:aminotransferase class IV [Candidatus Magnetoovum sp. WYHC-5]
MYVFINGKILPIEQAAVSVMDHGLLYGDGVFETMRVYAGRVFKIEEHLKRLRMGTSAIELNIPYSNEELTGHIYNTIETNGLLDATVRVTVTRGAGPLTLDIRLLTNPTVFILVQPFIGYPPEYYSDGIKVMVSTVQRNAKDALNPAIKSLNFLNNIMAKTESIKNNVGEALMLNNEGFLTECTVSNIFFINNKGLLCTPAVHCGILNGITREFIITLAKQNGIPVEEGRYTVADIYEAQEVFLTNTVMELLPVSSIDAIRYKQGVITYKLMNAYKDEIKRFKGEII